MVIIILLISSIIPFIEGLTDPCYPNPCGQNAQCRGTSGRPVCSCLPGHFGNPLTYCQRGECQDNFDCGPSQACRDYTCVSVCAGHCGVNAECSPHNHIPVCTCPPHYTGDPLVSCRPADPQEACHPTPCGPNTKCEVNSGGVPVCTCLPGYTGSPLAGCRHECESDYDCASSQTCHNFQCSAACKAGICAPTANCDVINHRAVCSCPKGYFGDPYVSCRAECLTNRDCPSDRPVCLGEKCINVCNGVCGVNANCEVRGATPICSCPRDMTGDPFVRCRPFEPEDLCTPNPCGANTKCTPGHDNTGKERPVCTCLPGYVGDALIACRRGDCQSDAECRSDQNCLDYECKPTCVGQCGADAICNAQNHVATCSCPPGYTGNAIARCYPDSQRRGRYYYYNKKK